jgi:hypothetical protein
MNHALPPILLADFVEVIGSVAFLFGLLMWVINQIREANKPAAPPRGRPAAAAPQPQPQAGVKAAGQQADPLRNQVEDFLRRAGRAPQGNQPGPAGQRRVRAGGPPEIEVLVNDDAAPGERRPLAEPLRPSDRPAMPSKQAAAELRKPSPPRRPAAPRQERETVAEHVAENVAARGRALAEQASRLGQRIIEEDHQFDVQLKAKFDHTVGTLTGSAVAAAEQAAAAASFEARPAAQIAAMLANPEGVRQAIVINEILHRPSDRW